MKSMNLVDLRSFLDFSFEDSIIKHRQKRIACNLSLPMLFIFSVKCIEEIISSMGLDSYTICNHLQEYPSGEGGSLLNC